MHQMRWETEERKKVRINVKKGIISYGEAFIDFIAKNESNTDFDPFLGGTTVNVAVGVQKLGAKARSKSILYLQVRQ